MTYEFFLEDTKTQDAVIRNLEIIGEASKNVSPELRDANPDIPLIKMGSVKFTLPSNLAASSPPEGLTCNAACGLEFLIPTLP